VSADRPTAPLTKYPLLGSIATKICAYLTAGALQFYSIFRGHKRDRCDRNLVFLHPN